jgi:hypothetical protein
MLQWIADPTPHRPPDVLGALAALGPSRRPRHDKVALKRAQRVADNMRRRDFYDREHFILWALLPRGG